MKRLASKSVQLTNYDSGPPSKMIGTKNAAFFISMCDDVLVEVLSSGNRKQLVILTKNGKRFSRLVDCFFVRAPFLRMDIGFCMDFSGHFHVSVGKRGSKAVDVETCCLSTAVPAYLRFDSARLEYDSLQEFERMKLRLQHFKNALIESKISITCSFDYNDSFNSSSIFLEHFVTEVLPIIDTDTSQSYTFALLVLANLYSKFDVEEILTGIIAALPNSSDLLFDFRLELRRKWWQHGMKEVCLPVNQISDWLTHKTHQQSGKKNKRSLYIFIDSCRVINYTKMSKRVEKAFEEAQFPTQPFIFYVEHPGYYRFNRGDSDQEMSDSSDEEEESFDKELFNKKTGEKLSIAFDGSQLEIEKN